MYSRIKRMTLSALALGTATLLIGCGKGSNHEHEWSEITCKDPKTCKICGATEGEPSPRHKWEEATCLKPATCSVCGETKGQATGHKPGDWEVDIEPTLSTSGEKSLHCKVCDEELESETVEKFFEADATGFNFDADELAAYIKTCTSYQLAEPETYEYKDMLLESYTVEDTKSGIQEVDVLSRDNKILSVLVDIDKDYQNSFKKVLTGLLRKFPNTSEDKAETVIGDEFWTDIEETDFLSFSDDAAIALDAASDEDLYICLSTGEYALADSITIADSLLRIPLYLDVEFDWNLILDKYGVDVTLNDEKLCSLKHGEGFTKLITVPTGEYTLTFAGNADIKTENSQTFTVTGPTTVNCEIKTHSKEIEFLNFELVDNVDKVAAVLPEVNGLLLSEAEATLKGTGFTEISTDIDAWYYEGTDYRVVRQKPKAGKIYPYTKKLLLHCEKIEEETDKAESGQTPADEADVSDETEHAESANEGFS